jgi:hypothetical protein
MFCRVFNDNVFIEPVIIVFIISNPKPHSQNVSIDSKSTMRWAQYSHGKAAASAPGISEKITLFAWFQY